MKNIEKELKYLKILSKQYPSISKASWFDYSDTR